jgi:hypothetical protein
MFCDGVQLLPTDVTVTGFVASTTTLLSTLETGGGSKGTTATVSKTGSSTSSSTVKVAATTSKEGIRRARHGNRFRFRVLVGGVLGVVVGLVGWFL